MGREQFSLSPLHSQLSARMTSKQAKLLMFIFIGYYFPQFETSHESILLLIKKKRKNNLGQQEEDRECVSMIFIIETKIFLHI